jgi:hypothetical protein
MFPSPLPPARKRNLFVNDRGFPGDSLCIESKPGNLFISTHRLVYVAPGFEQANRGQSEFATFSCPIDDKLVLRPSGGEIQLECDVNITDQGRSAVVTLLFPTSADVELMMLAYGKVKCPTRIKQ